jgi:glycosyltransferase involved in cell wall biosynthesis
MKRPSDIVVAIQDGRWGGAAARARAVADRWAAAAWLAARRGDGEPPESALVREALEAALLPAGAKVRVVGDDSGPPLDHLPPAAVGPALAGLAAEVDALVVVVPVWPAGRRAASSATRTLRRPEWWLAAAAEAGLEPWVELRRGGGHACLVLGWPRPAPPRATAPPVAPSGFHVRICDDLSRATSFTWISASIALALERIGVRVSIAPTELSASIEPARRRALEALVERGSAPRATAEVGWTHFWPEYRRPLGGEQPLALFAVNYAFADSSPDGWDPWMRGLVEGSQPLGPISTFCAEVLSSAGVGEERLDVVPLAPTEGLADAEPAELPRARALKLLHVTNASDPARHGTDVALAAFREAFAPGDDVTFVVRDYATSEPGFAAAVARLAAEGYDARYWPAFYPAHRLGTFLSAFDVLVAPFRGEGFGIKLLDAMACRLPVVGPRFGGPADFLDDDAAYVVPHRLEPVRAGADAALLALGNRPLWAETAAADVAARLRDCREDPAGLARRGEAARRVATRFTWERTAQAIVASVERRRR